jgi:very-short-patch-repair endonuclease
MSSIARHHNEWLSLIEISGPFLSLPVLLRTFPQGLDALDRDGLSELRLVYEEWLDDQNSLRPTPAIHTVWVRYIFEHILNFEKSNLLEGPAIPSTLSAFVAEQGETLRPDLMIVSNDPSAPKVRLLVQTYPISQGLEKSMQGHRWKASPAMRMLELLRATGVSLGMVTNGEQWMLVHAPKGETSAFISWYAGLWLEEPLTLRAFSSLLGAYRFFSVEDQDTLEGMLKESVNEQQEVTDQLGYQVRRAVEVLTRAVDKADQDRGRILLKNIRESDLYEAALTVMMRLVFLFSAEERGLLLLGDPLYDQNYAVSTLRAQLRETADQQGEDVLERRFDAWCRLLATFRAVHDGIHHDRLNLPAYGGSLFDPERYPFLEGRTSTSQDNDVEVLPISNRTVLHLLEALQILRVKVPGGGPAEARRLSFRALDVEQIGHVYEGLLDHVALRADDIVLGLIGTRDKEPEIELSTLHAEEAKGEKSFLAFLKEQTGRSENALRKELQVEPDVFNSQKFQIACNNDDDTYKKVARYSGLVREDDFGYPTVFLPGSVYITAGATRRATGTHYTPRSLTEPIVQHTLEPLVYTGPAEGFPKEKWVLKTPAELLELKVCDMAMGSAGFLVQVVRYLSERLVEAWDQITFTPDSIPFGDDVPEGDPNPSPLPEGDPHPNPLPEGEGVLKEALSSGMLARVRELRKNATDAEALLWEVLRDRQLDGYKFRRQHPLGGYILDFYCHDSRLAIEIDGSVHRETEQGQHDAQRSEFLNEQGITVVRFWNHEVIQETSSVLQKILRQLQSLAPTRSLPSHVGRRAGDEGKYLQITPEGKLATGKPGELILPKDDEERLILARRLVSDRCIYGVDKNPLAVEIAKLSIWLTTMDKGRPFTFLDHALKCGDSLVGADEEMYRNWAYDIKGAQFTLYLTSLEEMVETARQKRKELESFTVLDVRDTEHKAQLLKAADEAMARVKLGCDLLIGVRLLGLKPNEQETMLAHLLWDYVAGLPMESIDAQRALHAAHKEHAFHWPFEFPEVFEKGGFDAFISNPPFIGGLRISSRLGDDYYTYLRSSISDAGGTADICSYFMLRCFSSLRREGSLGLITTNTITQGDTREIGLNKVLINKGTIFRANSSMSWPGSAAVAVSVVHILKGEYKGNRDLDGLEVSYISSLLDSNSNEWQPASLKDNQGKYFNGSIAYGDGFLLTEEEKKKLIAKDSKNSQVIFPYMNGSDLYSTPDQSPSRWAIYFFDWPRKKAEEFPVLFEILEEKVYPERQKSKDKQRRETWWKFTRPTIDLYNSIRNLSQVLAVGFTSKTISFSFLPKGIIYTNALVIFCFDRYCEFGLLQSCFHQEWAIRYGSTLETRHRYTPSDVFETFPFPRNIEIIELISNRFYDARRNAMLKDQIGLTQIHNNINNLKITNIVISELRSLQIEMDNIVAVAYGWSDLDLGHGFHETPQGVRFTISEPARREVLNRLLQLNHERYEEDVKAGMHDKKKTSKTNAKTKKATRHKIKDQPSLLYTAEPAQESNLSATTPDEQSAPTPTNQIGSWDLCVCLGCGKRLVGFSVEEHSKAVHEGKDPGYRKVEK